MATELLVKTKVWYSIANGGDGSAYPHWYLTEEDAEWEQEHATEGWGESCTGSVETYEGSDIHREAVESSHELKAKVKAKALGRKDWSYNYDDLLEA